MRRCKVQILGCLSLFLGISSACLTTRAQLKEQQHDDHQNPAPPVEEVAPGSQYLVDELKTEMTRIQGRIEDLERTQQEGSSKSFAITKEDWKKLDERLSLIEQNQSRIEESLKQIQENPKLVDPDVLFKKAKGKYDEKEYEEAAELLLQYSKLPKVKKVEDAIYMAADSYFQLKQYKKAIVEYSKFPEKYSKSNRMPVALLKIGQSFDALGMKDDAKGFYQELIEKYPKSAEAKKIRKKGK